MPKMEIPKPAKTARAHRMAVPDASKTLGESIKKIGARGVDLGEGYVLVKIGVPKRRAPRAREEDFAFEPQRLPGVPVVSNADLQDLMKRFNRTLPAEIGASKVPEENQAFLDQFARKEMANRARLEQKGELVSSQTLADQMGVTRQAITKAVKEQRMFTLDGIGGRKLYPAFFADPTLDRGQLGKVSKELGHLAGSSKWQFFTNPRISLNRASPIKALREGKYAEVIAAAIAFREA